MKYIDWDPEKNKWLQENRGISYEECLIAMEHEGLLANIPNHPRSNQWKFIVKIKGYAYVIPYVEDDEKIFLKTIFPSRKETQKYLSGEKNQQ